MIKGESLRLDESLAFTALLELDPEGFGKLGQDEGTAMRRELQEDFYASDAKNMYEYTKEWLAARELAAQAPAGQWDEPEGAVTPRGWLRQVDGTCVGNYLDYGPEHYRSSHEYCRPDDLCRECQPGNVHAVRYPDGPGSEHRESGYFQTIGQARQFVEHGRQPTAEAEGHAAWPMGGKENRAEAQRGRRIHSGDDTVPDDRQHQDWAEHHAHLGGLVPGDGPDDQRQLLP